MLIYFIFSMFIMSSLMLMMMNAPASLGMMILIMSLTLSLLVSSMMYSWFGFMIFLIYISGMLVMFAYFSALQPNQYLTNKYMLFMILPAMISSYSIISSNPFSCMGPLMNNKITSMFTPETLILLTMVAMILFLALVMVVKISTNMKSPLRPFQNKYV